MTSTLTPAERHFLSLGTAPPDPAPEALTGATRQRTGSYLPAPPGPPARRRPPTTPREHREQLARLREQAYAHALTAGGPHQDRAAAVAAQNLAASLRAQVAELAGLLR